MLEINDGSGWKALHVYGVRDSRIDDMHFALHYDPCIPSFALVEKLSRARGHVLVRVGDDDPGDHYWVDLRDVPTLAPDRVMTVPLFLSLADLSDESDT